jgi:HCOMODA/2-hydroxy-3-carboxy-muconic semialdehyde decarboxylase
VRTLATAIIGGGVGTGAIPVHDIVPLRRRAPSPLAQLIVMTSPDVSGAAAPVSAGPVDPASIEDLVAASRILAAEGVLDGYGHVSTRHPARSDRYLMSRSLAPALVTADDIMELDLESNPVDPRGRTMFRERFIHGMIYRARPDVTAVVHSHSPAVIPFGITQVPMKPTFHMAAFLYDEPPVFEIRDVAGWTNMLITSNQLGEALARTLGAKSVALMRGHGNVVVGPSLPIAVFRAIYTEVNARLQTSAIGLGGPINYLSPEEGDIITNKHPGDVGRAWTLWKTKALGK